MNRGNSISTCNHWRSGKQFFSKKRASLEKTHEAIHFEYMLGAPSARDHAAALNYGPAFLRSLDIGGGLEKAEKKGFLRVGAKVKEETGFCSLLIETCFSEKSSQPEARRQPKEVEMFISRPKAPEDSDPRLGGT